MDTIYITCILVLLAAVLILDFIAYRFYIEFGELSKRVGLMDIEILELKNKIYELRGEMKMKQKENKPKNNKKSKKKGN